jgi:hypothetical protein
VVKPSSDREDMIVDAALDLSREHAVKNAHQEFKR